MKLFECQSCGQPLYFENVRCEACEHRLGYLSAEGTLSALEPEGDPAAGTWRALARPDGATFRFCSNAEYDACNWLLPSDAAETFCIACRYNRTVPDLSVPENLRRWRKLEHAKHYLFYTLLKFRLPMPTREEDPQEGLAFDFLADTTDAQGNVIRVITGHDHGLITLNIDEADDAAREKRRTAMKEPYRTLIGHFRHEIAHYYWDRLVRDDAPVLERYRALFGDERLDYGEALQHHYSNPPPADWQEQFVSTYATAHSWEDFAETFAHYLHIVDTLETARSFGIKVRPRIRKGHELRAEVDFSPYKHADIEDMIDVWLPLTFAVNSMNRSMGQPDLYPFVISPRVVEKLAFINDIIHGARADQASAAAPARSAA